MHPDMPTGELLAVGLSVVPAPTSATGDPEPPHAAITTPAGSTANAVATARRVADLLRLARVAGDRIVRVVALSAP
jgi:hypothetical protein